MPSSAHTGGAAGSGCGLSVGAEAETRFMGIHSEEEGPAPLWSPWLSLCIGASPPLTNMAERPCPGRWAAPAHGTVNPAEVAGTSLPPWHELGLWLTSLRVCLLFQEE